MALSPGAEAGQADQFVEQVRILHGQRILL